MIYVIVITCLALAAVFVLMGNKNSNEEFADYERYDSDPKWVAKHVTAIVLLGGVVLLNLFVESYDKMTNVLTLIMAIFLIFILALDIKDPRNRYIYINRNKIAVSGELIDRKTIKGYSISGIFKNADLVTYNGKKYRITKKQCKLLGELSKTYRFPWQKLG
ncbi:MAG: hypothetical protein K5648_07655 [Erysipelotrichaceae bacterium]|nr:hypothetical protein [Erysipelotrichaceae bacterium]